MDQDNRSGFWIRILDQDTGLAVCNMPVIERESSIKSVKDHDALRQNFVAGLLYDHKLSLEKYEKINILLSPL